jgi:hypothetical protein
MLRIDNDGDLCGNEFENFVRGVVYQGNRLLHTHLNIMELQKG